MIATKKGSTIEWNWRKKYGVVGVYQTLKKMKSGLRYPYYTTTIHVQKGKALTRARSRRLHGERAAFLQICEIRKDHMQEIYPDRFVEVRFDKSVEKHLQRIEKAILKTSRNSSLQLIT